MSPTPPTDLSISIVVHELNQPVLERVLACLVKAANEARTAGVLNKASLYLINNSDNHALLDSMPESVDLSSLELLTKTGHGNIGYGRGHNLAITETACDYHLVLNPDVFLQPDALVQGLAWLQSRPETVAVAPAISNGKGEPESACKQYPSVLDLLLRGFAPGFVRRLFQRRLARYSMQALSHNEPTDNIPIISGCCMLWRSSALRALDGFDPRYFLYFEDFDLSLRAHQHGSLSFVPAMRITHLGGNTARKGLRHILMFGRSAIRFFNSHGWRWF
jgi:GT2 family glycosyltransferase